MTIRFPSALMEELKDVAKEEQRSLNGEVIYIVRDYLARKRKEQRRGTREG